MISLCVDLKLDASLFCDALSLLDKAVARSAGVSMHFSKSFTEASELYVIEQVPRDRPLLSCCLVLRPSKRFAEFLAAAMCGALDCDVEVHIGLDGERRIVKMEIA